MDSGLVLFYSANAALRLEKALRKLDIPVKLIPTPRDLSSDCGTALKFPWDQVDKVEQSISDLGIDVAGVNRI